MHLLLLAVGKTDSRAIEELTKLYADRLGHYLPFTLHDHPRSSAAPASSPPELQKQMEGAEILRQTSTSSR